MEEAKVNQPSRGDISLPTNFPSCICCRTQNAMTSLSGNQGGYQGYPYTIPIVTEVQSVDPSTASKWSNLPRNQITVGKGANQNRNTTTIHGSSRPDQLHISTKKDADVELSLNVHRGLPRITSDQINQKRNEMRRVQDNSGYQGYPYRNHTVTEVQTIDPETASRWSNLPRNQITEGRGYNQNRGTSRPEHLNISKKNETDDELSMNVYIDLPIINPDETNQRQETRRVQNNSGYQGYPYRDTTVTEVQTMDPETAFKWAHLPRKPITDGRENQNRNNLVHGSPKPAQRPNAEEPPMNIYIDLPIIDPHEMNDRRDEGGSGETNSGFVEDTIFYDPFEDRRINVSRNQDSPLTDTPGSIPSPNGSEARTSIAGCSSGSNPISQDVTQSREPPFMSKETYLYGLRTEDDGFPLSPIPVSEFPEPPPAYSEVERRTTEPPRTVVVVPDRTATVGIASSSRKLLLCPHCGLQVHTLPVQENGPLTHVLAIIFLFIFLPLTLLIYCTDFCKYTNHYCPNCNQLIGYEVPILCQDMIYNKP